MVLISGFQPAPRPVDIAGGAQPASRRPVTGRQDAGSVAARECPARYLEGAGQGGDVSEDLPARSRGPGGGYPVQRRVRDPR
jgi:hypothetical protein